MRLLRLHVKRYGHFVDVPFDLGGEGLTLVYGPNEAGKTTLLEFIRELLFGFRERNDYDFGQGRIEGEASMKLASGQLVDIRRHKGRKNTVSVRMDGRDTPHDAGSFNTLLGNATETLFRSVFAFGLQELAAAEKGLAEESVRSALYSGGLATIASPRKISDALEAEAGSLFKERAHKSQVNALCSDLKSLQKQINEKSIRCESYEQRRAEMERARAEAERVDAEMAGLTREHSFVKKLTRALPVWLECKALHQDHHGLSVPAGFPADGKQRFEKLQEELQRLEDEQSTQQTAIQDIEVKLAKLTVDPRVADRKEEIKHVQERIQLVKEARRDLPVREREWEASLREVEKELAGLVPGWTTRELQAFRVTTKARAELNKLASDLAVLEKKRTALETDQEQVARDTASTQADLARLGDPEDVSPLVVLLAEQADHASNKKELARLRKAEREAANHLASLLPRLNPPLDNPTAEAHKLPVPPRETVDEFKLEMARLQVLVDKADYVVLTEEKKLGSLRKELAELNSGLSEVPSPERLGQLRAHRDEGWNLVRREYVDKEDASPEIETWLAGDRGSLPDVYEAAVQESDRYADSLFDKSRSVAKQEEIRVASEHITSQKQILEALRQLLTSVRSRWHDLWRGCGINPLEPEAMVGWIGHHDQLCLLVAQRADHAGAMHAVAEQIASFENRLRGALGTRDGEASRLLVVADQRVKAASEKERNRASLQNKLAQNQDRSRDTEEKLSKNRDAFQSWNLGREQILESLALPREWSLALAESVSSGLEKLQVKLERVHEKQGQAAELSQRLAEFDPLVRNLCTELAADLLDKPTEVAATTLRDRLAAHEQRVAQEERLASGNHKLREIQGKLQGASEQISALFTAAGATSPAEFLQVADRAERKAKLQENIAAKEREVVIIRENEPADEFEEQLRAADLEILRDGLQDLSDRLQRTKDEKTAADQTVGSCQQRLAELEKGSGEAAGLQEQRASKAAQLASAVDRYVPLLFARHLLQQAINRFEQESQPEMLREVSQIFRSMTGDRYSRVERPLDESAPLLIHRGDGESLVPDQLSTGTREQLYLSIRLAYVLHYCSRAEPLPIIMDDVLANFDDDRARQTLRGLGDITNRVQVIMFTCHPHLVSLAHQVFPSLKPIEIPRSGTGS